MNMPAISVIIPIYNMERLMRKCIDSILRQTFKDIEILLIDDGSTDNSPTICDEYKKVDERIRVFHKSNGGLSETRNFGLDHSQGKYIIFADPDDWVDCDWLEAMYATAKETNADVVMSDIYFNDKFRQTYGSQKPSSLNHWDILADIVIGRVSGFTVTKLIRKECYISYDIRFPKGIYGCEDQYAMCKLFKNRVAVAYIEKAYYHYMFYGNTTLSRKYGSETYKMDLAIRKMFTDLFEDESLKELAFNSKSYAIVWRAFMFGSHVFSSADFVKNFGGYKTIIAKNGTSLLEKIFLTLSIRGLYYFARMVYGIMFDVKQIYKRIRC
jgi:glycosyltransferase involved in cell wall biosynthesis